MRLSLWDFKTFISFLFLQRMHGWGLGHCYLQTWEWKYLLDQEENLRLKFLAIHFIWLDPIPAGQKNNSEKSLSYCSKFKVGCLGDIWTKLEVGFKFLSISISIENTFLPNLARYWQDIFQEMTATLKQKCQWWSQLISCQNLNPVVGMFS